MKFYKAELHTHTTHSDGKFTPQELADTAISEGIQVLAITDHNASTGTGGLKANDKLIVIPGIEWTTFWGHVVVLGGNSKVDWRTVNPRTCEEKIREAHGAGDAVILAHPRRLSGPVCSGCFFEMPLGDYIGVTGIEVCSSEPSKAERGSPEAYKMWRDLLDGGKKIGAFYGRDWHGKIKYNPMYTYVGAEEFTPQAILAGILAKRVFITSKTMVPVITLYSCGNPFYYGDTVPAHDIEITSNCKDIMLTGKDFSVSVDFKGDLAPGYYFLQTKEKDFISSPFYVK